jgi:hypothetical protein
LVTYIALGIGTICFILVLLRDVFCTKTLNNTSLKEYFSLPQSHEYGSVILLSKLPRLPILGDFGSILLFIAIIVGIPTFVSALIDGSLFLEEPNQGFFQDILLPIGILTASFVAYYVRNVMQFLPTAVDTLVKYRINEGMLGKNKPKTLEYVKLFASFIFQTKNVRSKTWITFDISLGVLLVVAINYLQIDLINSEVQNWNFPKYILGNITMIYAWFVYVYFARIAISYIVRVSVALWRLGKILSENNLLDIEPLHPDGAGGLSGYGRITWRMSFILAPIIIFVIIASFFSGMQVYISIIAGCCVILIPILFLMPVWGIHSSMAKAKRDERELLSKRFNYYAPIINSWLTKKDGISEEEGIAAQEEIERIQKLYEQAMKMPVWPFDASTLSRAFGFMIAVVIPFIVNILQVR